MVMMLCGLMSDTLTSHIWMTPWKNQISSTTMKLRKSHVKHGRIYRVVWFFHPRSSCMTHLMLFSEHLPIYVSSCMSSMTILGGRTKQLDIIAGLLPRHWLYEWLLSTENVCRVSTYVVQDDLGWKNWTTRYNRFRRAGCSRLEYVDICLVY